MRDLAIPFSLLHRLALICPYTRRICSSWDITMCVRSFLSTEAWICDILGCHGAPLSYWRMDVPQPRRWLDDDLVTFADFAQKTPLHPCISCISILEFPKWCYL